MCDISGIQATTQAYLEHGMLNMLVMKIQQCKGSRYLISYEWAKFRHLLYFFSSCTQYWHQFCNLIFTDETSIDAYALSECMQIRLCIKTCLHTSFTQDSFNKRCC